MKVSSFLLGETSTMSIRVLFKAILWFVNADMEQKVWSDISV